MPSTLDDAWSAMTGQANRLHGLWSRRCPLLREILCPLFEVGFRGSSVVQRVKEVQVCLHDEITSLRAYARVCHTRFMVHQNRLRHHLHRMGGPAAEEERLQRKVCSSEWESRGKNTSREIAFMQHCSRQIAFWLGMTVHELPPPPGNPESRDEVYSDDETHPVARRYNKELFRLEKSVHLHIVLRTGGAQLECDQEPLLCCINDWVIPR